MEKNSELFEFVTEDVIPGLEELFPEIDTGLSRSQLAGHVYRLLRLTGKLLFEAREAEEEFVKGEPVPLPNVSMERHPDEVRAFYEPRPWYKTAFSTELENVGDYFDLLNTGSQILPGGKPASDGGEGYLQGSWTRYPWMAELFQELWEREHYRELIRSFQQLPDKRVNRDQIVAPVSAFFQAQMEIDEIDRERLEKFINEKLFPRVEQANIWEHDEFWEKLGEWVDDRRE